jgi:hypothetical protein
VPSAEAEVDLRSEAEAWFKRLRDERKITSKRHKSDTDKGRADGSLINDARSLAYMVWLADKLNSESERLVFVTGDRLTFDAYRRWHIEYKTPGSPFLVRRLIQYTPILNLNRISTPGISVQAQDLFERTRQGVEVPLVVFNLSRLPPAASDQERVHKGIARKHNAPVRNTAHGREHLAQFLSTAPTLSSSDLGVREKILYAFFTRHLTEKWIQDRRLEFRKLRDEWQAMERTAIGANFKVVGERLNDLLAELSKLAEFNNLDEARDYLIGFIQDKLETIVENSIRVWYPLADDFIQAAPRRRLTSRDAVPRIPFALRLAIPTADDTAGEERELTTLVQDWINRDPKAGKLLSIRENGLLATRPDIVFGIAATLALRLQHWNDALRFSDLAWSAASVASKKAKQSGPLSDEQLEFLFLQALARRFRIGELNPGRSGSIENIWKSLLTEAVERLDKCISARPNIGGVGTLRHYRALSERAAVRMFYASWGAITQERFLKERAFERSDAVAELANAVSDLRACWDLQHLAEERANESAGLKTFYERVRRQVDANSAASQVIGEIFVKADPGIAGSAWRMTQPELDRSFKRALHWSKHPDFSLFFPLMAQVDVQAFIAIQGNDVKEALRCGALIETASDKRLLSIDTRMLREIKALLRQKFPSELAH